MDELDLLTRLANKAAPYAVATLIVLAASRDGEVGKVAQEVLGVLFLVYVFF